ncbi:MAG: energy-dependent translational throttle protein EttA [Rhodanobacteraceae bacterium]
MSLLQLRQVDYSVGGPLLLDGIDFTLEANERVCVVGRNGAGKSTLLKLIGGDIRPDDGVIQVEGGTRIARLAQEVPQATAGSVFDVVAQGLGELGGWLAQFHQLSHALDVPGNTEALSAVQSRIEAAQGWDLDRRVGDVLQRLDLPEDLDFAALSGGMKRRVLLAQALVQAPDVLLLDEPTNHLDIESIAWMEEFLRQFRGSIVFITHDRSFLRALATRIVEIDRGTLTSWPGDYDNYLRRREERLHAEAQENARFDKLLAQEEVWIRQGIKARRTRDEGRVRRLKQMRVERAQRRELGGNARMELADASRSGKRVVEAKNVYFAFERRPMVVNFSCTIQRGDRIGIIGPNGSGKTTLLQLLLGERAPDRGDIQLGTNLEIAYFDQHRVQLRDDLNALDNVAEGREYVELNGSRKHIVGYLQDFLFTPERARAPITALSGGERNRLLLAKLFSKPSNLLVMDEPTNDLDVETLELLEDILADYTGTLLLVSHDRAFIDNVVTSTLVLEGEGRVAEYVGGYSDWLRQRPTPRARTAPVAAKPAAPAAASEPAPAGKRKLSYKDQRELEQLPARIEQLESAIAGIGAAMNDPAFFQQAPAAIVASNQRLADLQAELDRAYARWGELEG